MNLLLRPWKAFNRLNILSQFIVLGAIISFAMGFFLTNLMGPILTQFTLGQQQLSFLTAVNRTASNLLEPIDFAYPPSVESTKRLTEFASRLQVPGLFRVKIWNTRGIIVYSDQPELIGKYFPPTQGFEKAMNLQSDIGVTTFDPLNNYYFYEIAYREGIEAFTPISLGPTRAVVGVLETYTKTQFLDNEIQKAKYNLTLRIAISLIIMFATLSLVVRQASRRIDAQAHELSRYASGLELLVKERTREVEQAARKRSEQSVELERKVIELAHAKAKDDSILSSIGEGMIATDQEGNVTFMNEQAEMLLGWDFAEAGGMTCRALFKMSDSSGRPVPPEKHPIGLALGTHKRIKVSVMAAPMTCERKDGTSFPIAMTVAPIVVNDILTGTVAIFRDVTRETEIDRAKTEFVSLASHQLRTPLAIINWHAETLLAGEKGPLTDAQRKYLEEMYRGSKRLGALVNAFLNVSRLELGTFIVEPKPVTLADIASDVLKDLAFTIGQRGIAVTERYADNVPVISADPQLVRIIFQNLLANAVKYATDRGKVSVTIEKKLRGELAGGRPAYTDCALITVSDDGIGIPEKDQRRIFSKLYRADNAREKITEGTGLGLYIIRSILDHAGGTIWFDSEENRGSTFYVLLPLTGMQRKEGTRSLT